MKEFTLEKSLIHVNSVGSVLAKHHNSRDIPWFTLERGLTSVSNVANILADQDI